jgi:hypothetical protein
MHVLRNMRARARACVRELALIDAHALVAPSEGIDRSKLAHDLSLVRPQQIGARII